MITARQHYSDKYKGGEMNDNNEQHEVYLFS